MLEAFIVKNQTLEAIVSVASEESLEAFIVENQTLEAIVEEA